MAHPTTRWTTPCLLIMIAPGCLDPVQGGVEGGACEGTAFTRLADHEEGAFAIGPCGEVARWVERGARALEVYSGAHRRVAVLEDPNGYSGGVVIAQDGTKVAFSSLRSDLGFGDVTVAPATRLDQGQVIAFSGGAAYRFSKGGRLVVWESDEAPMGNGNHLKGEGLSGIGPLALMTQPGEQGDMSSWDRRRAMSASDGLEPAELTVFAVRRDPADGALEGTRDPLTLERFDESDFSRVALGAIEPGWHDAATVRTRERVRVARDGGRALVVSECQDMMGFECGSSAARVIDLATGEVDLAVSGWRSPELGPTSIVVGRRLDDDALVMLERAGSVQTLAGVSLVAVTDGGAIVLRDGDLTEWEESAAGAGAEPVTRRITTGVETVTTSPGGSAAAFVRPEDKTLGVWRDHRLVAGPDQVEGLAGVWEDGSAAVFRKGRLVLVDPRGQALGEWPQGCPEELKRRGGWVFFRSCEESGQRLIRVSIETGEARELLHAERGGQASSLAFEVSRDGRFLAATFVPWGQTRRELHAGRLE